MNTRLFVSTDLPATHDAGGFEALNWTEFDRKGGKMNITKVFRTDDGEIFETKKEAEEYVAQEKWLDGLVSYLKERYVSVSEESIREVLFVLSEDYDVVLRCED